MSTLKVDNIQTSAAGLMPVIKDSAGVEIGQMATAWVIFTGSTGVILSSFNVASVTRVSAAHYIINLATNMVNTTYTILGSADGSGSQSTYTQYDSAVAAKTVSSVGIRSYSAVAGAYIDANSTTVVFFGGK